MVGSSEVPLGSDQQINQYIRESILGSLLFVYNDLSFCNEERFGAPCGLGGAEKVIRTF